MCGPAGASYLAVAKRGMDNQPLPHLIFDIDGVLCDKFYFPSDEAALMFLRKGDVFKIGFPHYIYPGVIELFKALYKIEGIRISFFSAGNKERNIPFVRALLQRALDPDRFEEIFAKTRIFSKHHRNRSYKDLRRTLEEGESLSDTILIDDSEDVIFPGQEDNWLQVPAASLAFRDPSDWKLANQIYFVAGKIFALLERSKQKKKSLKETLVAMRQENQDRFYADGLIRLRVHTPSLDFIRFDPSLRERATAAEQERLFQLRKEADDWFDDVEESKSLYEDADRTCILL